MIYGLIESNNHINKIIKKIRKNDCDAKIIVFAYSNFNNLGIPLSVRKLDRIKRIEADLIIEIPSFIFINCFNNLYQIIIQYTTILKIDTFILNSKFSTLKQFYDFYAANSSVYPRFDDLLFYYSKKTKNEEHAIFNAKSTVESFYRQTDFDYFNQKFINAFKGRIILNKTVFDIQMNPSQSYFCLIKYLFQNKSSTELLKYKDFDISTINMIKNKISKINCFTEFEILCQSKKFMYSTFFKAIFNVLINYNKIKIKELSNIPVNYMRVLGFTLSGKQLINKIKKESSLSIITNLHPKNNLHQQYEKDCTNLYYYLFQDFFSTIEQEEELFCYPLFIFK